MPTLGELWSDVPTPAEKPVEKIRSQGLRHWLDNEVARVARESAKAYAPAQNTLDYAGGNPGRIAALQMADDELLADPMVARRMALSPLSRIGAEGTRGPLGLLQVYQQAGNPHLLGWHNQSHDRASVIGMSPDDKRERMAATLVHEFGHAGSNRLRLHEHPTMLRLKDKYPKLFWGLEEIRQRAQDRRIEMALIKEDSGTGKSLSAKSREFDSSRNAIRKAIVDADLPDNEYYRLIGAFEELNANPRAR